MTVAELDRRMTAKEFAKWRFYAGIEPFGARTHHLMTAQLTALLFNVNRGSKSDKVMSLYDFDLYEDERDRSAREGVEEKQAQKDVLASFEAWNARFENK